AVVELRAPAEVAQRVAQLRLDDRVHDDRRTALRPVDDEPQVVHGLDPRMADLLERLLGKLGLEGRDQPGRGLAGGVGDDVQLDRRGRHLYLTLLSGGSGTLSPCAFWSWTTSAPSGRRSSGRCASKATRSSWPRTGSRRCWCSPVGVPTRSCSTS